MTLANPPATVPTFFDDLGRLPAGHDAATGGVVGEARKSMMAAGVRRGRDGYVATTVTDILARAGVSRRTFYEHFDDREACFLRAYDHVAQILSTAMLDLLSTNERWAEGLRDALDLFLRTVAAHPRLARACLVEILAAGPGGLDRRDASLAPFQQFIETGRSAAAEPATVPETVAETVVGGIVATVSMRVLHGKAATVPELLDQLVFWAMVPFAGPEQAGAAFARTFRPALKNRRDARTSVQSNRSVFRTARLSRKQDAAISHPLVGSCSPSG